MEVSQLQAAQSSMRSGRTHRTDSRSTANKFIGQSSGWNTTVPPASPRPSAADMYSTRNSVAFLPSEGAAPHVIHPNSRAFALAARHA